MEETNSHVYAAHSKSTASIYRTWNSFLPLGHLSLKIHYVKFDITVPPGHLCQKPNIEYLFGRYYIRPHFKFLTLGFYCYVKNLRQFFYLRFSDKCLWPSQTWKFLKRSRIRKRDLFVESWDPKNESNCLTFFMLKPLLFCSAKLCRSSA